uniref:Uncharacterized protein n=1 Tax=Oryza punctata TaxID=4537 RepID=A0A0E0JLS4_ORYPU
MPDVEAGSVADPPRPRSCCCCACLRGNTGKALLRAAIVVILFVVVSVGFADESVGAKLAVESVALLSCIERRLGRAAATTAAPMKKEDAGRLLVQAQLPAGFRIEGLPREYS